MFEPVKNTNNVYPIKDARDVKASINDLMPFLTCEVSAVTARNYVNVLVKHDMLYYFEEDANDVTVIGDDFKNIEEVSKFTSRQAGMLNVVRARFMMDDVAYKALFDAVLNADANLIDEETLSLLAQQDEYEVAEQVYLQSMG